MPRSTAPSARITHGAISVRTAPATQASASCHGSFQYVLSPICGPPCGTDHAHTGSVSSPSAVAHHVTAIVNMAIPTGSMSRKYAAARQPAPSPSGRTRDAGTHPNCRDAEEAAARAEQPSARKSSA